MRPVFLRQMDVSNGVGVDFTEKIYKYRKKAL
jgi:hypothetical protein